jgi:hypothetical protein
LQADSLQQVYKDFEAIGHRLAELSDDKEVGDGGVRALIGWMHDQWSLPQATLVVWCRIAKGELPRAIKDTQIQDSTLSMMGTELAEEIVAGKTGTIASAKEGRCVEKPVRDFTREEHSVYTRSQGILSIDKVHFDAPYRRMRVSKVRWTDDGKTLEVTVDSERIHLLIARELLQPPAKTEAA